MPSPFRIYSVMPFLPCCLVVVLGLFSNGAQADSGFPSLDGLWFSCEYAHSKSPPPDQCQTLDDDGFLVKGDYIWYMKVQDGDREGCRGERPGNCFRRDRSQLTATQSEIGQLQLTESGAIINYLWCDQAYEITDRDIFSEIRPTGGLCFWASDKTYYVAKWRGQMAIVDNAPPQPNRP